MRGSRATIVLAVVVVTGDDGTMRYEIELDDGDGSPSVFAIEEALYEAEDEAEPSPRQDLVDVQPRDHIEAQSLDNLREAVRRMRQRGMRVSLQLIRDRWHEWSGVRPEASALGAAQRLQSARSIPEWVKDLIR